MTFFPSPPVIQVSQKSRYSGQDVLCGIGVIDAFDLEERGVGVRVALAALVRQVLAFHVY